jgi:hypothetical protein
LLSGIASLIADRRSPIATGADAWGDCMTGDTERNPEMRENEALPDPLWRFRSGMFVRLLVSSQAATSMPSSFPIHSRDGEQSIRSLADWKRFAGPVSGDQWAEGYSALELARSWLEHEPLPDLRKILDLIPELSSFTAERGVPEMKSSFDAYRGPRTHDLLVIGDAAGGRTVLTVEGKVNEPFGQTLDQYRAAAKRLLEQNPDTNAPARLDELVWALAGWKLSVDQAVDHRMKLRYQLFTAVAGTVAAGTKEDAAAAVFCVHELETPRSDPRARATNASDLECFIRLLYPHAARCVGPNGWITGPLRVANPTRRLSADVTLYVAKLTTIAAP